MKVAQTLAQVVLDQLFGTRLELSQGLGWFLALLARRRPAETETRRLPAGPAAGEVPMDGAPQPEEPMGRHCPVATAAPDGELLEDLRRVHAITDSCSMFFYRAFGRFEPDILVRRFGSWLDACERAGLIGAAGLRPGDALGPEDLLDRMSPCLRCDREFKSQGPHNRLCPPCRSRLRK
jgi:hypothetical protein